MLNLETLTDEELLRVVDRSNREVKELAQRLEFALASINIAIDTLVIVRNDLGG